MTFVVIGALRANRFVASTGENSKLAFIMDQPDLSGSKMVATMKPLVLTQK